MRNRSSFNNLFSRNRKVLYIILNIVIVSVLTLTVVYATLSTTLNINGHADVVASNWDIHLDNVQLNSRSATSTSPTITNSTSAIFSTTLTTPGDFYEFTIDVVNEGSIDAMIDSVIKTPELSDTQKKYLNYIVEYQNGEAITTKQLVSKNSYVRLKVKVEFRKDISASDLPTTSETLDLAFTVNYTQADETGANVTDNGVVKKTYEIINGDLETVGSEVAIGDEHFYIISSDLTTVTMLAKYNITTDALPKQSTSASTLAFSSDKYWYDGSAVKAEYGTGYFQYVYDRNSSLYPHIENYKSYLESKGTIVIDARLINEAEITNLGCNLEERTCNSAPEWVYNQNYWSGIVFMYTVIDIDPVEKIWPLPHSSHNGCRPVITIVI